MEKLPLPGRALFDRRLLLVTGKGGVGKSVVAAALALLASRRGRSALLVQMDTEDRLADLFEAGRVGVHVSPVRENVSGIVISPRVVMEEYLQSRLRFRTISSQILQSRLFNYFYEAAPALKELVCLLKLHRLVEEKSWWSSRHVWDTVVFDAPSTGHSLGLWDVPESASHILLGPMKTSALRVRDMFRDAETTALNIVTLPEEMPTNEAEALHRTARDALEMPLGYLFLNAVFPERIGRADVSALEGLERGGELALAAKAALGEAGEKAADGLLPAARFAAERGELSSRYRDEARERIRMPLVEIPWLHSPRFGFREVERVAAIIEERIAPRSAGVSA